MRLKSVFHKPKTVFFSTILPIFIALVLGVVSGLFIKDMLEPAPFDPLGPYPVQQVHATNNKLIDSEVNPNVVIPAVSIEDEFIRVNGVKCSNQEVNIKGTITWRSVVPGGFYYNAPPGTGARADGCEQFEFENEIPDEVREWALGVLSHQQNPELFVSGCETPIDDNGEKGQELCWRTETFAFIDGGQN